MGYNNGGEKFLPLPLFPSVLSGFLRFGLVFGFRFRFICFRFIATLPSISFVLSLSSVSSLSPPFGSLLPPPPLRFFSSLFIGAAPVGGPWLVRLQSRNGWSATLAFGGGGGGEERETQENFQNFSFLFC